MKILVRAPNWLGDAVMSTPFLKRLAARFPQATLDVVVKPSLAGFFEKAPGVRRAWSLEGPEEDLKRENYDRAYVLPSSFSAAWKMFRLGIPERIGHAAEGRSLLLTKAALLDERHHYTRRYLQLIDEEGSDAIPENLYFPAEGPIPAGLPETGPILALAPGSRAPARRWPAEHFARAAENWQGPVLILGAPEDAPQAQAVLRAARRPITDLCGKTPLPTLGAVLRKCAALLCNESGLMHAAWALGVPTVVAAGPSEPRCTSPFGARVAVLQRRDLPCVPCVRNECFLPAEKHEACLKGLSSTLASDALKRLSER